MKELVEVIAKALVDNPGEVVVTEKEEGTKTQHGFYRRRNNAPGIAGFLNRGRMLNRRGGRRRQLCAAFAAESGIIGELRTALIAEHPEKSPLLLCAGNTCLITCAREPRCRSATGRS